MREGIGIILSLTSEFTASDIAASDNTASDITTAGFTTSWFSDAEGSGFYNWTEVGNWVPLSSFYYISYISFSLGDSSISVLFISTWLKFDACSLSFS